MLKLYILVYSNSIKQETLIELFNKNSNIEFWFISLPQSIFFKTTLTATEINSWMVQHFGNAAQFTTEISASNYNGMLPENHIKYFNSRTSRTVI